MTRVIKEIFSWIWNNHSLTTKDISIYEKVAKAGFEAANEVHHHKVNMMKFG